jgi:uncharacterized membrane protein
MRVRLAAVTAVIALGLGIGTASAMVAEPESVTNTRGYRLLKDGDIQAAIAVFQQNVAEHPGSANVYDSLGEAYVAAGDTPRAVASYRKALEINPKSKSARYALERLTGERRPPRPSVMFHIAAGITGLLAGLAAMVLRKGSRRHAVAGRVFVVAMVVMGGSGALIAFLDPLGDAVNVAMGILACYLAVTAWLTARRVGEVLWYDQVATIVAIAVAFALVNLGLSAADSGGSKDGVPAAAYFVFAIVPSLAAIGDIRMIEGGGIAGARRIARHLWRMCTALLIAAGSFFLGQPQVFPDALRQSTGLRALPVLALLVAMIAWMIRMRFTDAYRRMGAPVSAT